jgi:hypothetical protein
VDPGAHPYPPGLDEASGAGGAFRDTALRDLWARGYTLPDGAVLFAPQINPDWFYMSQLAWYDQRIQQDAYVVGAAVFIVGATDDWRRFDIFDYPVVDYLISYLEANRMTTSSLIGKRIELTGHCILRNGPTLTGTQRLTAIYKGTIFTVQDEKPGWLRVTDNGWITDRYYRVVG